jgi:hypothetical protein
MAKRPISSKRLAQHTARVEAIERIRQAADGGVATVDTGNPKDAYGEAKVDLSLCPPAAMVYMALGMMEGARKYGAWNFRQTKIKAMVYTAAAVRHIKKWEDGQNIDEESLKEELGHAMASLAILIDAIENGNLIDNRPPKGNMAELLNKWKKPVKV